MALADILLTLASHQVRFIAVGGIAAVLRGAPVYTRDVDIVYDFAEDNLDRLLAALHELDAVFRDDPRNLRPNRSRRRCVRHRRRRSPYPSAHAGSIDPSEAKAHATERQADAATA